MRLLSRLDGSGSQVLYTVPLFLLLGPLPTFVSFQMSTGVKTFFAGGLGSFSFWLFAMPFDNVKKYARPKAFASLNLLIPYPV